MKISTVSMIVVTVMALLLTACGAPATPAPATNTVQPTNPPAAAAKVNDVGRTLPDDAAASEQQVYVLPFHQSDAKFADISANVYNRGGLADLYAIPLTRLNKDFQTI